MNDACVEKTYFNFINFSISYFFVVDKMTFAVNMKEVLIIFCGRNRVLYR